MGHFFKNQASKDYNGGERLYKNHVEKLTKDDVIDYHTKISVIGKFVI